MADCKITKVEVPVLVENLTEEQITQLFNRICEQDPVLFDAFANGDGTIEGATTGPIPVTCQNSLLVRSSTGTITVDLTTGSAIYDINVDPSALPNVSSITNVDLSLDASSDDDTFVLSMDVEWVDQDGNTQTTTDSTPVTIELPESTITTFLTSNTVYDLLNFPLEVQPILQAMPQRAIP